MNPTPRSTRLRQGLRRHRGRVAATLAILAVLTGGGSVAVSQAMADADPCDAKTDLFCIEDAPASAETTDSVDELVTDPADESGEADATLEEAAPEVAGTEAGTDTEPSTDMETGTGTESSVDTETGTDTETAGQNATSEIRTAIDEAMRMLKDYPDCESKMTGKSKYKASVILGTLDANNRLKDATSRSKTQLLSGRPVAAEAVSQGDGSNGTITFYAGWLLPSTTTTLSDEESRVLTLLHELGHLTGSLSAKDSDAAVWEDEVKGACIVPARTK